jgi:hypothetical protein
VALFDAYGKPVNQLVHDAAGDVEITYLQEQIYRITSNDTGIAIGDIGGIGALVTSGDLADPADPDQTYSTAVIDGSTINQANAQLEVVGKVDRLDNEYGTTGTEVYVRIAPSRYQAA